MSDQLSSAMLAKLKELNAPPGAPQPVDAVDKADERLNTEKSDTARAMRVGLWALGIGFGGFLLWAGLAPLDEGVPSPAMVTIDTKRKPVQHQTGGIIKEVLVETVARNHPANPGALSNNELWACRKFLKPFLHDKDGHVFTLNYDLLLYWTLMNQGDPEDRTPFELRKNDSFGNDEDDPDAQGHTHREAGYQWRSQRRLVVGDQQDEAEINHQHHDRKDTRQSVALFDQLLKFRVASDRGVRRRFHLLPPSDQIVFRITKPPPS